MRILWLGYRHNCLVDYLRFQDCAVVVTERKMCFKEIKACNPDFIISYGYRFILKKKTVAAYRNRIINLHISYLPWNRGVDPNLWSIIEHTQRGVSIHYIDDGIDTGPILCQKKVKILDSASLQESYDMLRCEIEQLFITHWPSIIDGTLISTVQPSSGGTFHTIQDTKPYLGMIADNWEISIAEFRQKCKME